MRSVKKQRVADFPSALPLSQIAVSAEHFARCPQVAATAAQLTDAHVAAYEKDGFIIVQEMLGVDDRRLLCAEADMLQVRLLSPPCCHHHCTAQITVG
jgi:hypothetical protein